MSRRIALVAVGLLTCTTASAADLYKCLDTAGKTTWQDRSCDGEAKPTAVRPANGSIQAAPSRDYTTENKLFAERERARDRELAASRRDQQAFVARCRTLADEAEAETAWLKSVSEAVRASARIRIEQLGKQRQDAGC